MAEKLKLSLFGFYEYGNFGDDLMAVMIGQELQNCNFSLKVFGLNEKICQEFSFDRANSIPDLLDGASAVVYGGGGAFISGSAAPGSTIGNFNSNLMRLCEECNRRKIPIYAISVGGDNGDLQKLDPARLMLLDSASYISFRNPEESEVIKRASCPHDVFSDIVWSVLDFFKVQRRRSSKKVIGIDIALIKKPKARIIISLIKTAALLSRGNYRFVFIKQGLTVNPDPQSEKNCVFYQGIRQFITEISAFDLIITHRLHVGMVAMALGIPVVELFPTRKALMLFERLGLTDLCVSNIGSISSLIFSFLNPKALQTLRGCLNRADIDALRADSAGHLAGLRRVLGTVP